MAKKWMVLLGFGVLAAQASAGAPPVLNGEKDMVSYGFGIYMGRSFKKDEIEIDHQLMLKGLQDGLAGTAAVPEKTLREAMRAFQGETQRKALARLRVLASENEKKGAAFLADNKTREGVVTLASGLEYKVLKQGEGRKATEADSVECHYRGRLLDGTEFDATEPGQPATLKVAQLIPGWKEALKLMPAGSKWEIAIPPTLAYGPRGAGSEIGPNETLLFEVELVAVK